MCGRDAIGWSKCRSPTSQSIRSSTPTGPRISRLQRDCSTLVKCLERVDEGLHDAPNERDSHKAPGEDELDAVAGASGWLSAGHHCLPNTGAPSTSASASTARM